MNNKIKISLFVLLIIGIIGINILYKNKSNIPRPKSNLAMVMEIIQILPQYPLVVMF